MEKEPQTHNLHSSRPEKHIQPHPATRKNEGFDSVQELTRIKSLPRPERRHALKTYKERLYEQKEAIAVISEMLLSEMRRHPDAPLAYFLQAFETAAEGKDLSDTQRAIFRETIRATRTQREAVVTLREQFPNDIELFKHLFGFKPHAPIHISLGPLNFRVVIESLSDFARISSDAFLSRRPASKPEKSAALLTGGETIAHCLADTLDRGVVVINSSKDTEDELIKTGERWTQKDFLVHEEQHVINNFLTRRPVGQMIKEFLRETPPESIPATFEIATQILRKTEADWEYKNEMLAFYRMGATPQEIEENLMGTGTAYGTRHYVKETLKFFKQHLGDAFEIHRTEAERAAEKVMVLQLKQIQRAALSAIEMLETAKIPRSRIISLLQNEPFAHWRTFARKYLERKKLNTQSRS